MMFRFNAVLVDHEEQVKNDYDDNIYNSDVISIRESRKWGNPMVAKLEYDSNYRGWIYPQGQSAKTYKNDIIKKFYDIYAMNSKYPPSSEYHFNYDFLILDFGLTDKIENDKLNQILDDIKFMNEFLKDVKTKIPGIKVYVQNVLRLTDDNSIYNYIYNELDFDLIDYFVYFTMDDSTYFSYNGYGYNYDVMYKCLEQIDNKYLEFIYDSYIKMFCDYIQRESEVVKYLIRIYNMSTRYSYEIPHIKISEVILNIKSIYETNGVI